MLDETLQKFDAALVAEGKRPLLADLAPALTASEVAAALAGVSPAPHDDVVSWYGIHNGGSESAPAWQLLSLAAAVAHRNELLADEDIEFPVDFFPVAVDSLETTAVSAETGAVFSHDLVMDTVEIATSLVEWLVSEADRLDLDLDADPPVPARAAGSTPTTWTPPQGGRIVSSQPFDLISVLTVVDHDDGQAVYRVSVADPDRYVMLARVEGTVHELSVQPKPSNETWGRGLAINGTDLLLVPRKFEPSESLHVFDYPGDAKASITWEKQNGYAVSSCAGRPSTLLNLESAHTTALNPGAQFCGQGLVWLDAPTKVRFGLPEEKIYTLRIEKLGLDGLEPMPVVDETAGSFAVRSSTERGGFVLVQYRDRRKLEQPRIDVCREDAHLVRVIFSQAFTVRPEGDHLQHYTWNFFQNTHDVIGGPHPHNAPVPVVAMGSNFYQHTVQPDASLALQGVRFPKNENRLFAPLRATLDDGPLRAPTVVVVTCFFEDLDEDGQKALFVKYMPDEPATQVSSGVVISRAKADASRKIVVWQTQDGLEWKGVKGGDLRSFACSVGVDQWSLVGSSHLAVNHEDHLEFAPLEP